MDYLAAIDKPLLEHAGLVTFDALWALDLQAVDEPNTARGGWSVVSRIELAGQAYYLKRQSNYLTRSILHPLGEPTFAREFRNIERYKQLGIPALRAAFFGQRQVSGEVRALLLTEALDGWKDLYQWLDDWAQIPAQERLAVVDATAQLARRLHDCRQLHGCFYPKHIFLRKKSEGFDACLIDLEKTRPMLWKRRDSIKDLETLLRRTARSWDQCDVEYFLRVYLANTPHSERFRRQLMRRFRDKANR